MSPQDEDDASRARRRARRPARQRETVHNEFKVRLDREGAQWLAEQAELQFLSTHDYGWDEIARDLRMQLEGDDT